MSVVIFQPKVELWANESLQTVLNQLADELRFVLITSQVVVHPFAEQGEATEMEGLRVQVSAAEGENVHVAGMSFLM